MHKLYSTMQAMAFQMKKIKARTYYQLTAMART